MPSNTWGFQIEASHHEVAPSQHEIDFRFSDVLSTADNVITFKYVVKSIAYHKGYYATVMPKPLFGVNGSGMHSNQSLFKEGKNAFYDPSTPTQLSQEAMYYIGGLLKRKREFTAITNPVVNSYKRIVPGYDAPIYKTWSAQNRSSLIRIPATRGEGTRIELRCPDPACNPYLAFALMLRTGLDGIKNKIDPGEPTNVNICHLTEKEREERSIRSLPADLKEAIDEMQGSAFIEAVLGDHVFSHYLCAKKMEWDEYKSIVHPWELSTYLHML